MANAQANSERKDNAPVRSPIYLRIFAFLVLTAICAALFARVRPSNPIRIFAVLVLTATSVALFAMPYLAG